LMPWISEATTNNQLYLDLKKYSEPLDPIKAGELAESVGSYTPGITETKDDVALAIMQKSDTYTLSQQLAINSGKIMNEPVRQTATYTVEPGETITEIAQRFNLHVATILDANGIKAEDAKKIAAGTILNVPSSDTSTSTDWMVAINKADETERQAAEQKRQALLATTQKYSSRALAASSSTSQSASSSGYDGVDNSGLSVPIASRGISQRFGNGHTGIDYMANVGTGVAAAAAGKVVVISTGWSGGYGNQIVVDHGGGRQTRYAHLSSIGVSVGETVNRGKIIGRSGNTGRSTGPHLHFELIINGRPVPPF